MNIEGEDLKYYAFDWDDNLMTLPTKIKLKKENKILEFSTKEFAEIRNQINKGIYKILENDGSFINFREEGDNQFIKDVINIEKKNLGPSWENFIECINSGRIFSIITARGHSIEAFRYIIKFLIEYEIHGINKEKLLDNMFEFIQLEHEKGKIVDSSIDLNDQDILKKYLDLVKIYPVSNTKVMNNYGFGAEKLSPEIAKINALKHFAGHIKKQAGNLFHDYESPNMRFGFSDDDPKNIEAIQAFIEKGGIGKDLLIFLYNTANGNRKKMIYA